VVFVDPVPVVDPAPVADPVPVADPEAPRLVPVPVPGAVEEPIPLPTGVPNPDPRPLPDALVLAGPPPNRLTFAFICSTRGSYRNSHVGYVVCSFTTTIESPDAALPTPRNGAPPPVKLVAD